MVERKLNTRRAKTMPSQLKSDTARANGAKSRGPKSTATRAKSSLNATRHGFTAHNTVLLQCEDPDLFQKIRAEYLATYVPATPAEEVLVDEMIVARWRIQRLWTIETALFDCEVSRQQPEMDKAAQPNPAANLALAFRALADESYSLALLSRYESRLHRMHERTYRTLRELHQERQQPSQPEAPPSAPSKQNPPPAPIERARETPAPKTVSRPGSENKNCESNPPATR